MLCEESDKSRGEPCREADERDREYDINRKSYGNVCARIESLFTVDEERHYLRKNVAEVCRDENAEPCGNYAGRRIGSFRIEYAEKVIFTVKKII